jgi:hypothetical protein
MAEDREKISNGPNDRPLNETIAGTGPGIPDEAPSPDGQLFQPPSEEEEAQIRERLHAPAESTPCRSTENRALLTDQVRKIADQHGAGQVVQRMRSHR